MAGKSVTPFDLYRANLSFALQMGSFSHEARQQVSEFDMQRIRRDLAAAHAIRNAVSTAHDWSELSRLTSPRCAITWRPPQTSGSKGWTLPCDCKADSAKACAKRWRPGKRSGASNGRRMPP
ncbi:hypothetical protein SAMN05445850_8586 [Paraburkholderia tuberum]|uniref:Uncharacterized protein n=1 Tax=Paraburkholderia tuberum TaxID=157910 RepID=A0A1H1KM00_9BURK|nr:hypothetical protein SAMN05445850_8586 [Paraburkholderia tuberum]